jgi:predicted amidohydrolase
MIKASTKTIIGGIVIYPDDGGLIFNYPEQHIFNAPAKKYCYE